jgi:hypothetical protein
MRLAQSEFGGYLEPSGWLSVGAFGRNPVPVSVRMSSHLIDLIKKFYKCCTFNSICKKKCYS